MGRRTLRPKRITELWNADRVGIELPHLDREVIEVKDLKVQWSIFSFRSAPTISVFVSVGSKTSISELIYSGRIFLFDTIAGFNGISIFDNFSIIRNFFRIDYFPKSIKWRKIYLIFNFEQRLLKPTSEKFVIFILENFGIWKKKKKKKKTIE